MTVVRVNDACEVLSTMPGMLMNYCLVLMRKLASYFLENMQEKRAIKVDPY